jgi:murein DD-endopeptidase MepM/ murein hydrolase activator NlpD
MNLQDWQKYTYHPPLLDKHIIGFKHGQKYPSGFGNLTGQPHLGQDYIIPINKPIYAIADGITKSSRGIQAGNMVTLRTNRGLSVRYMHLNTFTSLSNGRVSRGDIIGFTGNTGKSTAPHLHMDIFRGAVTNINQFYNFVDPLTLTYSTNMEQNQTPEEIELAKEFNYQGKDFETRICENYEILQAYPVLFLAHKYGYVDGNHDWNGKNIRRFVKWWAQYKSKEAFKIAIERDYQGWLKEQNK